MSTGAANLPLSRSAIEAIEDELDALRAEIVADLGADDAAYVRRMIRLARASAIAGRSLLMLGVDPVSWALGVAALSTAKILENMEIGHNVMHGQYDWTNDPALDSQTYEWDNVCDGDQWRHSHNLQHHTHTNVVGRDRDVGYGFLRLDDAQPWRPHHLAQPLTNALLALAFEWGVGLHDVEVDEVIRGQVSREELRRRLRPFLRKAARQIFKDYVLFPALALGNAPRVFVGNLAANLVRNVWAYLVIFCGHFPDGARTYTVEETQGETRGDWYVRQISGSCNFDGSRALHVLSGHLSHQIEHHLFPDLPAPRYAEIAPRVRALCARYGLPYNTGSLWRQYATVVRRIVRHAVPPGLRPAFV
jgi:linoleoyl-CoA desaturase